eukprot:m.112449 g.112449  ORF g.112449 m.112449 type:complete len:280 (+) comp9116_c0_seq1:610-1449(+)
MEAVLKSFQHALRQAKHVVILTGAGVSAESGVPTFRGAGGLWRNFSVFNLASWEAFERDPSLVWEFYEYRRELMSHCRPNAGHHAIAELQQRLRSSGRTCSIITQNIDGLHQLAGADVIEMHGSLWLTKEAVPPHLDPYKFLKEDGVVFEMRQIPICPALEGKGGVIGATTGTVPVEELPHHNGRLLRPAVVWFGEQLDSRVLESIRRELQLCDLLLVVGTSGTVYPAAGYSQTVASRGVKVAHFNMEAVAHGATCEWMFEGPSGEWLPRALGPDSPDA